MVRLQNQPPPELELSKDLQIVPVVSGERRATCELDLQFYGDERSLEVILDYALDLFEPAALERLLQQHESVLEEFVADPQRRLSQFSALGKTQEQRQLLSGTRQTEHWRTTSVSLRSLSVKCGAPRKHWPAAIRRAG